MKLIINFCNFYSHSSFREAQIFFLNKIDNFFKKILIFFNFCCQTKFSEGTGSSCLSPSGYTTAYTYTFWSFRCPFYKKTIYVRINIGNLFGILNALNISSIIFWDKRAWSACYIYYALNVSTGYKNYSKFFGLKRASPLLWVY